MTEFVEFNKTISDGPFQLTYMNFDETKYTIQLEEKRQQMIENLSLHHVDIETFTSPPKHFRNRVKFGVVGGGGNGDGEVQYVMWEYGKPSVEIECFPIACSLINKAMWHLREYLNRPIEVDNTALSQVKSVNFLSTTTKKSLVIALIYEKHLDVINWPLEASKLQDTLINVLGISDISIIAKARKQKLLVGTGWVMENFELTSGRSVVYKQVEDGFSNPNGYVNRHSLNWLCSVVNDIECTIKSQSTSPHERSVTASHDLLELYCGNGNHTVAISTFVKRVVAVELNKSLCDTAIENLEMNGVDNVKIVHCDSEKFSNRILRMKRYIDLDDQGNEIQYNFSTVLVDPPRAGLDDKTRALVAAFDDIIYISCNPDALKRDLLELLKDHDIKRFAVFDHFAYTHHLECGCYLSKKIC